MKRAEKPKRRFWAGVSGALLLTLLGIVLVVQVITQYGQIFMENQDDYLLHLAQSVDKNISNLLDRYEYSMNYVTSRRDFREAQERLRQDGDSARMLELLEQVVILVFHKDLPVLGDDLNHQHDAQQGQQQRSAYSRPKPAFGFFRLLHRFTPLVKRDFFDYTNHHKG